MIAVALVGLLVLLGLAFAAGVLVGRERHVGEGQRLAGQRWRLYRWEQELISATDLDGCPSCVLLRRREGLQRSLRDGSLR